ncbi:MAG: rhodanese-like domain-containing protein [Bacteroidota bacterium]
MKNIIRLFLPAIAAVLLSLTGTVCAQQSSPSVSVKETYTMLQKDTSVVFLDVRTPEEHAQARIGETPLIPLNELENRLGELERYKDRKIVVYCRSGNRSGKATSILRQHGFNALNMQGGIIQWKQEQYPIISGQ